jgi:hypothetical protein
VSSFTSQALAGGDGGGGSDFRKNPAVKDSYSQREFARLSKNEINQLYVNMTQKKGSTIDGFSNSMSDHLVTMAQSHRRRTSKLVLQMKELKTKKERVARLRQEQQWAETEFGKLKTAKARAESKENKKAAQETQGQMNRIWRYREAVETWSRYPHEGQR